MARETKVGLIVGLGVILFVSVFVSDYLSVPQDAEAFGTSTDASNFNQQTTNQTEMRLTRNGQPVATPVDPAQFDPAHFAAVSLDRQGVTTGNTQRPGSEPPRRQDGPAPIRPIDVTPIAIRAHGTPIEPIRLPGVGEHGLANENHLPILPGSGDLVLPDIPEIAITPPQLEHTVKAGETLISIARKHYAGDANMWRSIRDANPGKVGDNGEVAEGATLVIPRRSAQALDPVAGLTERTEAGERPERTRVRIITVKDGETLSELAYEHLGSANKWQLLMDVNADVLEKPEQLRAGMKLRIPAEETTRAVEEANEALGGPAPAPRDTTKTYTVKSGDNLYKIAEKVLGDGDRYKEIYKANKDKLASPDAIKVGMKLKLPER